MAHATSAAALHTAREILKRFDLAVRPPDSLPSGSMPNLTNSEAHVAVLVDYATNVFEVALLRPELREWTKRLQAGVASAAQLANFLNKIVETFAKVPQDSKAVEVVRDFDSHIPPEFLAGATRRMKISRASFEVARFVLYYYAVTAKGVTSPDDELNRVAVAEIAEMSLNLNRAFRALPMARETKERLVAGKAPVDELRKCLREIGVHLEYLSGYKDRREEVRILV